MKTRGEGEGILNFNYMHLSTQEILAFVSVNLEQKYFGHLLRKYLFEYQKFIDTVYSSKELKHFFPK